MIHFSPRKQSEENAKANNKQQKNNSTEISLFLNTSLEKSKTANFNTI
jgi:hypothetical protein